MRLTIFQVIVIATLLFPGSVNAKFTSENCEKITMAYTGLLLKSAMIEILGRDLNEDLRQAVKRAPETTGDAAALEAIQKKYESRLKLVHSDMKEIREGNAALKALCMRE